MAKRCVACAEKIQSEAVKCRFCGAEQPAVPQRKTSAAAKVIGVVLIALFVATYFMSGDPSAIPAKAPPAPTPSTPPKPPELHFLDVHYATKTVIKEFLKAPATAEFDEIEIIGEAPGHYFMTGAKVDSENAFGAKLRSEFIAVFRMELERGLWRPRYLPTAVREAGKVKDLKAFLLLNGWPEEALKGKAKK